ncbi:MAG: LPS assembly lipoprotein LptE [Planctomycetota bacterium]|nr:LPS assembly lipoprotein LptE [Planctomycetota bacterium]
MKRAPWLLVGLALVLAGLLGACGYSTGFRPPEGRTVGVAFFENVSKLRDLDRDLQGPLSEAVQRIVHAPLVSPELADYRIEGKILEFRRRNGIRDGQNRLLETGVQVVVEARLVRGGSVGPDGLPEVLRRVRVGDERGYLKSDPLGEAGALERVLRNVSDRIVIELFADLAWTPQ